MASGIYAAWLTAGDDEDYLPFTRPAAPRGWRARAKIAVVMSTLTYEIYANFTDIGRKVWRGEPWSGNPIGQPWADPTLFREVYGYIEQNALYGLYDVHVDGSAMAYGSYLRPILNMRPKFRYRTLGAPARFPADLYLVDWLDHKGFEVDYLTDYDLHTEGADLLRPYAVVLSSGHHEYWTSAMLDGLERYLGQGGRFMYLSGNGLFGVTSIDPQEGRIGWELLLAGALPWPFEMLPWRAPHHSMTGELGGIWSNRGRALLEQCVGRCRHGGGRLRSGFALQTHAGLL